MPRKKVKRSSATKTTVKVKRQVPNLTESLEKSFREMPAKIAMQTQKDLIALKQQEAKLQSSLQKMQKQQKTINNKQSSLASKDKLSTAAKKQLKVSKKASDVLNKAIANILKQIDQNRQQGKTLSQKQAKYVAIKKQIIKLEKEWNQTSAKTTKTTKPAPKARKSRASTPATTHDTAASEPMMLDSTESIELNS
ncbi:MAG TPA: hypothetical protein VHM20_03135 [Gammaproteobacteria bacterium]|jgi:hypothetical protein|nr:hypothetical protein [Gammaproteobacteria bacterium]